MLRISALLLFALASASPVLADETSGASAAGGADKPILGHLDPVTGAFRPLAAPAGPDAVQTITGKVVLHVTVSVTSAALVVNKLYCSQYVQPYEGRFADEAYVTGTMNGATGSCTMTLNYKWMVNTATDYLAVGFSIYGYDNSGHELRSHSQTVVQKATLPPNGGTVTYNAAATL